MKKTQLLIAKEILANTTLGLLYPFGLHRSKRKSPRKKDQRTIVLLHGFGANRSNFFPMAAYLKVCGFKKVLFYNYPSTKGVEKAAIELKEYLQTHVKGGDIDFVCHSMGGIVARAYLQLLGGSRRVNTCITLGTPHKGTYNAYWLPTQVGTELRPDSELLRKLHETEVNSSSVDFYSITGNSDNIILPRESTEHGENINIPGVGHSGLLVSIRVMKEVAKFLEK
ncbi:MAG: alpha/beta fold hydrolase [Bacteriovoracaceae bacterium]|nr:alpha/beta fold hydrolase [Bacteriovoracaceae bacterium]